MPGSVQHSTSHRQWALQQRAEVAIQPPLPPCQGTTMCIECHDHRVDYTTCAIQTKDVLPSLTRCPDMLGAAVCYYT
eukprot:6489159-Amphidinium_carterae.1